MNVSKVKVFGGLILASIVLAIITCLMNACGNIAMSALGQSICFFYMTYFALRRFAESQNVGVWLIVVAICLGYEIVFLPVRIVDFWQSLSSVMLESTVCLSCILAGLYYKTKSAIVLALSIVVVLLITFLGFNAWEEFAQHRFV